MKKDIDTVKVKFYKDTESDVFAYFPMMFEIDNFKLCYAHVGQHSVCHPDYLKECKIATRHEYKELREELESIGYKLNILN